MKEQHHRQNLLMMRLFTQQMIVSMSLWVGVERSSKIVILLSDEEGQSLQMPTARTETQMCSEINPSFVLAVLGTGSTLSSFEECVPNLLLWNVGSGTEYAIELLRSLIQDPCL